MGKNLDRVKNPLSISVIYISTKQFERKSNGIKSFPRPLLPSREAKNDKLDLKFFKNKDGFPGDRAPGFLF